MPKGWEPCPDCENGESCDEDGKIICPRCDGSALVPPSDVCCRAGETDEEPAYKCSDCPDRTTASTRKQPPEEDR